VGKKHWKLRTSCTSHSMATTSHLLYTLEPMQKSFCCTLQCQSEILQLVKFSSNWTNYRILLIILASEEFEWQNEQVIEEDRTFGTSVYASYLRQKHNKELSNFCSNSSFSFGYWKSQTRNHLKEMKLLKTLQITWHWWYSSYVFPENG
jgi:hypothetical protein